MQTSKTFMTCPAFNKVSMQQKKSYTKNLSYKKVWEKVCHKLRCEDPKVGKFCTLGMKFGRPPRRAKGWWETRGIVDWNHATIIQKQHRGSKWHQDSSITAGMAACRAAECH